MDNQGVTASHVNFGNSDPHLDSATLTSFITKGVSDTNPSRPDVSVPNFLYELKDFPELLKKKGEAHAKTRPSNSSVEYNFGWNLLFQDINRMLNFTDSVNKRVKELKSLHSHRGLRRKRVLRHDTYKSIQTGVTLHSVEAYVEGSIYSTTTDTVWVTVRWRPDDISATMPSDEELVRQARLVVHGWDFSSGGLASVIWEAIPWSWLADYFGNLGDYLGSQRNAVGCFPAVACAMRHLYTVKDVVITTKPSVAVVTPPRIIFEDKMRQLGSASLSASINFLSQRQLANLSSIAFNLGRR